MLSTGWKKGITAFTVTLREAVAKAYGGSLVISTNGLGAHLRRRYNPLSFHAHHLEEGLYLTFP